MLIWRDLRRTAVERNVTDLLDYSKEPACVFVRPFAPSSQSRRGDQ